MAYKQKGWSAFTKKSELTPQTVKDKGHSRHIYKKGDYTPQSKRTFGDEEWMGMKTPQSVKSKKEYTPQSQRGKKLKSAFPKKTDPPKAKYNANQTDKRVFEVDQERYDNWNKNKNRGQGPDVRYLGAKENKQHLDNYLSWKKKGEKYGFNEDGSPYKKKTDPPKKKGGIAPILVETAAISKAQKGRQEPTWMGTDEYRKPEDIPAQEYLDRGLNPADYIPGYRKPSKKAKKQIMIPPKVRK